MDSQDYALLGLQLLAVFVLVLINGFFVAAEFALVKIRETQLTTLIAKGNRRARIARRVIQNLDASLSACQLGITLASIGLGWIGEPIFSRLLDPVMNAVGIGSPGVRKTLAAVVGMSVITFFHITAGEQAPKWLAIQKPLPTSLLVVQPLAWFHRASYPFIWLLNQASLLLLRIVGIHPEGSAEHSHSEEEIRVLLTTSQHRAGETPLGRNILLNALDLRRRVVRDVMRPRQEITAFDTQATIAECLDLAEKTRYSRFPLCENGNLDKTLGAVHIKDLFALRLKARTAADLVPAAWKLIYVPDSAQLENLLRLFLDRKLHMAIVVDEYGGTIGLITLENILEELVGQIQDEFDQEKPLLQKTGDQTWQLAGSLPLHELAELVAEPIAADGITTANGWVTQRLGGFPKSGDVIAIGDYELRVEEMEGVRVSRLSLTRVRTPPADTTVP
ncbi:MAG: hemolysin family protein [Verrucomicrobiota bacterium]